MSHLAMKLSFGPRLALTVILVLGLVLAGRTERASAATPFNVTRTKDLQDTNPGDGRCDGIPDILIPGDQCTLRAAIMETNALNDNHTIVVPAGIYMLDLTGAGDDSAETGDLDILHSMTIQG